MRIIYPNIDSNKLPTIKIIPIEAYAKDIKKPIKNNAIVAHRVPIYTIE